MGTNYNYKAIDLWFSEHAGLYVIIIDSHTFRYQPVPPDDERLLVDWTVTSLFINYIIKAITNGNQR